MTNEDAAFLSGRRHLDLVRLDDLDETMVVGAVGSTPTNLARLVDELAAELRELSIVLSTLTQNEFGVSNHAERSSDTPTALAPSVCREAVARLSANMGECEQASTDIRETEEATERHRAQADDLAESVNQARWQLMNELGLTSMSDQEFDSELPNRSAVAGRIGRVRRRQRAADVMDVARDLMLNAPERKHGTLERLRIAAGDSAAAAGRRARNAEQQARTEFLDDHGNQVAAFIREKHGLDNEEQMHAASEALADEALRRSSALDQRLTPDIQAARWLAQLLERQLLMAQRALGEALKVDGQPPADGEQRS